MPAFSYAQVARGPSDAPSQAAVKDVKEVPLDQLQSTKSNSKAESQVQSNKSSTGRSRAEEKESNKAAKDETASPSKLDEAPDKENLPLTNARRNQHKSSSSGAASPNSAEFATAVKENAITPLTAESLETSAVLEKDSNTSENNKTKDLDDDWEKVSIPSSAAAEKELRAAPPPVVNIWQQRMEQEAKKRELAGTKSSTAASSATTAKPTEANKRKGHDREASNMSRSANKPHDASNHAIRATSYGETKGSQPLVGDTTSWPTPETAIVEERKKSIQNDKVDARPAAKNKTWVQMPFVPTAKFETQLPPSHSKRGGRTARNPREGSGRGGHYNNSDRNDHAGAMGPPPPKQAGEHDRGRKNDANPGGRASSLPAGNQRNASRESQMTNIRKPSAPVAKEPSVPAQAPTAPPFVPSVDANDAVNSGEPSRSSSSQQVTPAAESNDVAETTAATSATEAVGEVSEQLPAQEAPIRQPGANDRKSGTSNYRSGEYHRSGNTRDREYTREKSDAREKVQSWRDREYSGEGPNRRDTRAERGRGTYRGRGNFNSYQGNHPYTAPLPQNGFDAPKNSGEPRSRQTSQPYPSTHPNQNRNTNRAQSIPVTMMYPPQNFYGNVPVMQQNMSLQTDMQAYGMQPQMGMQQGIMSAMPYNDSLSSYAIMSLVATQLQYYFSIDNLCKDLFLRKNMDSQGWVSLNVIAGFKRIKQLTEDNQPTKVLRDVLPSLPEVEYFRSQDGEEHIRRRLNWQDFVLPMQERLPHAQHDGPVLPSDYSQHYQQLPQHSGEAMPFVPNQIRPMPPFNPMLAGPSSPPAYGAFSPSEGTGGNDRGPTYGSRFESRRESATSPVSQELHQRMPMGTYQNGTGPPVNGHHRTVSRSFTEENIFADEEIEKVHVFKRTHGHTGDAESASLPPVEKVLSNESQRSAELRGGKQQGRISSDQ